MEKLTLVLLPGLDGSGDLFASFIEALGPEFKTTIVRYPVGEPMGYQELEALVRQRLPASEPIAILGESFSGPIAVSIAATPPPNLVATVLCCTFTSNPQPNLSHLRWLLPLASHRLAPLAVVSAFLLGKQSSPALRDLLASALAKLSTAAFRARLAAVLGVNVTAKLASVQSPVLYLQALQDRLVPAGASAKVLQANVSIQVAKLEGPHFLLQTSPALAAEVVGAFLTAQQNAG